jgi:hypothetical protein
MKDCAGARSFIPSAEQPFPGASPSVAISRQDRTNGGYRTSVLFRLSQCVTTIAVTGHHDAATATVVAHLAGAEGLPPAALRLPRISDARDDDTKGVDAQSEDWDPG